MENIVRFNELRILQNLNPGEKSGDKLFEDLVLYKHKYQNFDVLLHNFESEDELIALFEEIKKRISENKRFPIVHFEVHGNKKGIELTSGAFIKWEVLVNELVKINLLTRNNLIVSMGVCFGSYLSLSAFEKGIMKSGRCAFIGLVAPENEVTFDVIYQAFHRFYTKLLSGDSFEDAIKDADGKSNLYFLYASEIMVKKLVVAMMQLMDSMVFNDDALNNLDKLLKDNKDPLPGKTYHKKLKHVKKLMRSMYESNMFQIRNKYLMIDLFSENAKRFEPFEDIWNQYISK